jgi:hypothetical protein
MPTAALVSLNFNADNWNDFESKKCIFNWIITPKDID